MRVVRLVAALLLGSSAAAAIAQGAAPASPPAMLDSQAAAPVGAASANGDGSLDIVVTATRQNESLSKVPLSVVAITPARIDAQGLRNIRDITRVTPGLALTPVSGSGDVAGTTNVISIRGVSSPVGSPTTGIYIDDTPIQSRPLINATNNAYPQLFDLERIEVLRGPQGTLFGAGAEGGAIRFITPKPGLKDFTTVGRAELAFTENGAPTYEAGAAFGGPIIEDKLGFRISAWYRREGGYVDRTDDTGKTVLDNNANDLSSYVLRGALTWQVSERLSATATVLHQDQTQADVPSFYSTISDPDAGKFKASRVIPSRFKDRFTIPSLDLRYEGAGFDVLSTSSYFKRSVYRELDYTKFISSVLFGNPYLFLPGERESAELFDRQGVLTQELRIQSTSTGRLKWVVGGFYSRAKQSTLQLNFDPNLNALLARFGAPPLPLLPGNRALIQRLATKDEQKAVFGQVDYEILDGLKLTAGVRAAKINLGQTRVASGPISGGASNFFDDSSEKPVTPKFGISYQATPDTLVYASASKGYRIGGINGSQLAFCNSTLAQLGITKAPDQYDSDSLWSYEGGLKTKLLGGRLNLAASAFDIEWKNIQTLVNLAQCNGSFIVNVGAARVTGFDLAADFRVTPNFTISSSVGYSNSRLTEDFAGPTTTTGQATFFGRKGDKVGGPPLTVTFSGEYEHEIAGGRTLYARTDYQRVSRGAKIDYGIFGTDPLSRRSEGFDQLSLRTGIRMQDIDISLFVDNVLDQAPLLTYRRTRISPADNLFNSTTIRPRTAGLTVTYRH